MISTTVLTVPTLTRRQEHEATQADLTRLSVLIPVFNSQDSIGRLVDELATLLRGQIGELEILLVNDGSVDRSHESAVAAAWRHPGVVKYIRLARNFGEHNAVMCGLRHVTGDCVVILDDDFQNPPSEVLGLVERLKEGYDVVYGRYEQKRHSVFRNLGSRFNDWVAMQLLPKPKGLYLSSFKAMNRFLVDTVVEYTGPYPYLDGLILRTTNRIGQQTCKHDDRQVGQSNYTLRRLVSLWLKMVTGFSIAPLRIATILGFVMSSVGFLLAAFFIVSWARGGILSQNIVPGWASLIVCVTVFAGLQLCMLGMIGEYLGRLFMTANRAPQFVVRETLGFEETAYRVR